MRKQGVTLYESFMNNLQETNSVKDNSFDECDKAKSKIDLKEVFKKSRHKRITESLQGLAEVIWGSDTGVIADKEHMGEDYEVFKSLNDYIEGLEDSYNSGDITKDEMIKEIKSESKAKGLIDEEVEKIVSFYERSYSDYPDDASSEEFNMYDQDHDKTVRVWKQDGKWYDDEGNRYMGYLTKQDVKSYFKGNWQEIK